MPLRHPPPLPPARCQLLPAPACRSGAHLQLTQQQPHSPFLLALHCCFCSLCSSVKLKLTAVALPVRGGAGVRVEEEARGILLTERACRATCCAAPLAMRRTALALRSASTPGRRGRYPEVPGSTPHSCTHNRRPKAAGMYVC
jgi:hypothetical protein